MIRREPPDLLRLVVAVPNPYLRRIEERLTRAQKRRMILCLNARGRSKSIGYVFTTKHKRG